MPGLLFLSSCQRDQAGESQSIALQAEVEKEPKASEDPEPGANSEHLDSVDFQQTEPVREVIISFGGDVMFDTYIYNWISVMGTDYPWQDVAPIFRSSDIGVVNFESSSSHRGESTKPEGYGFCSPPHTLASLPDAGITYVSVSNNHILDYGYEAFSDTLQYLKAQEIHFSGAGESLTAAQRPAIIEGNGLSIGFLSYTAILPHQGWKATNYGPGVASLYDESDVLLALENIARCKEICDILIVMPHWGIEYADHPMAAQRTLAYRLIDAGADLIIGGHPHVLQGVEFYQGKPIFYSLGNFIFLKMDDDAGRTAVFRLTIDDQGFKSCTLYPVYIENCKANLLAEDHWMHALILDRFALLCDALGTKWEGASLLRP
ncbi:MAG: CapA family protein [Symbiobacteriaceae bacterium]|nr:CapA family protein [Symbiobacteriaceae bacterium]